MVNTLLVWAQFAAAAAVVAYAGYRLVVYGNAIADLTGLGATFIGVTLVSAITSLPELATGLSSLLIAQEPNLAVGNVLGSCAFNLLILLALELLHPKESIYARASQGHILAAGLGIILIGVVGLGVVMQQEGEALAIAHVGVMTPVILAIYLVGLRLLYIQESSEHRLPAQESPKARGAITLRSAIRGYAVAAAFVLGAGTALPVLGEQIAEGMGWNTSFVGTTLLAFSTSLPEIAVTLAAIRIGALDMAVANLVGSNLFNTAIIAIEDLFYFPGPLLAAVSSHSR